MQFFNKIKIIKRTVRKTIIPMVLAICAITSPLTSLAYAYGQVASEPRDKNQCGDEVYWELKDGTLTITGQGEMYGYSKVINDNPPWYEQKDKIHNVVISEGITKIGSYAFRECSNLTNITIPSSVTELGKFALASTGLKNVEIPNSVEHMGVALFDECHSLESVKISNKVETLKNSVFYGCKNLKSIEIPESVTTIEIGAFFGCSSLTRVDIPKSVESIEEFVFTNCNYVRFC
jgi:hypothetical protein